MIDEFLGTKAKVNVYGYNLNLWFVLIVVLLILSGIIIWAISMFIKKDPVSTPNDEVIYDENEV